MTKHTQINLLKQLAVLGAVNDFIELSSQEFASRIGVSQQTASRLIIELEAAGLVRRRMGVKKQQLMLAERAVEELRKEYASYQRIFEREDTLFISGELMTGLGEGQYYISKEGYMKQFVEKLGFAPYPGTLNVHIHGSETNKLQRLRDEEGIEINEFVAEGRTFGAVRCFKCSIKNHSCAVLFPTRSHHSNVLEVISAHNLRTELGLHDGDSVELAIFLK